ncbi:MAG: IS66 family insertion sequence element accessory protein TnpB [Pseudomonadota bacterium]
MIRPGADARIHLYRDAVDMRKSINGLVAIVEAEMALDPFSAQVFIFCNRQRTLIKMVAWEGNGFVLLMKRLDKSRFQWPRSMPLSVVELNTQQIDWLLSGYDLTVMQGHHQLAHHRVL